jgi:hypothetical protein
MTATERGLRRAAAIGAVGMFVELVSALHWTPLTFILSAALGLPLVLLGGALFLRTVWKLMKERGAA